MTCNNNFIVSDPNTSELVMYRVDEGSAVEVGRFATRDVIDASILTPAELANALGVTVDFSSLDDPEVLPLLSDEKDQALLGATRDGKLHLPHDSDFHSIGDAGPSAAVLSGGDVPIAAIDQRGSSIWHWVTDFYTLDPTPAYSFVDQNGVVFSAWNAEGRTVVGGVGPVGEASDTVVTPQQFGADENTTGNFAPEFQAAFDFLEGIGGGTLYIPDGTYTFSSTVFIPGSVEIVGQSREGAILQANQSNSFQTLTLLDFEGTPDNQKVVAMFASKFAADDGEDRFVRDVKFRNLTIDWNEAPAGGVSSMGPLVLSRVRGGEIDNVTFANTLDGSLLDDTEAEVRGGALIFAFAEDYTVRNSSFGAGDYYTIRTNLLCRNLRFEDNLYDVDKPLTMRRQRHIIEANRPTPMSAALISRFGTDQTRDIYILRGRAICNNVNDYFSSHAATGLHVKGVVCEAKPGATNDGQMVLRAHDGARDVFFLDNFIDMRDAVNAPTVFAAAMVVDTENAVVRGNICRYRADSIDNTSARGVFTIGTTSNPTEGAVLADNVIEVTDYQDRPLRAIWAAGEGITISGNTVAFKDPVETITANGPRIIQIDAGADITITGNTARGDYSQTNGLLIDGSVDRVVETGNNIQSA